jgi:hypothetical protein
MIVNYEEKSRESLLKTSPHQEGLDAIPSTYIEQLQIEFSRIDLDPGNPGRKTGRLIRWELYKKSNARISTRGEGIYQ